MTELQLLLIDDDEDTFVLVRDFLADAAQDWSVTWAPTYEDGVLRLASGHFDAALLDYNLGARTGIDLLGEVGALAGLPPIVLLTGQGDRAIDLAAMATGAADYLHKGQLSPALLERTVRHALERDRSVAELRASEARYHGLFEKAGDSVLISDDQGRCVDANPAACELFGLPRGRLIGESLGRLMAAPRPAGDLLTTSAEFLDAGECRGDIRIERPDGTVRDAEFVANSGYAPGRNLAILRDHTERRAAETALAATEARFRMSVEAMLDPFAILIAMRDATGTIVDFAIEFANEPLIRLFGLETGHVITSSLLRALPAHATSGLFDAYRGVVDTGLPYVRDEVVLEDQLANGNLVRLAMDLRVVRLGDGVAVSGREVSAAVKARTALAQRIAFADALGRLEQRETPEETGRDLTDAIGQLPGIDVATLLTFDESGDMTVLAVSAPAAYPVEAGQTIPRDRADYLRRQSIDGPWSEAWGPDDEHPGGAFLTSLGLAGAAYAPITNTNGPIGLVGLGTFDSKFAARISDQLPAAIEFAAAARSLIAGPLGLRRATRASHRRVMGLIQGRRSHPVFQPVVDLASGRAIGYEALTRFDDGIRPDLVFAEAERAGVGLELEEATLADAVTGSYELTAGPWLSLNVSAELILSGDRLARILGRRTRPIILEITEHDSIADYKAVRDAIAALGPDVRVAVDDAGAGVANFTHIVELRPDFVKVDASLIHGVDHDLTRQALIAGLRHFTEATQGWVIAEGVETEDERQTLLGMDLTIGQGYLFGRPDRAHAWTSPDAQTTWRASTPKRVLSRAR